MQMKSSIEIIEYKNEHQPWFEKFNRDWIVKNFTMEPIDYEVLQHPQQYIIDDGGSILMIVSNNEIAGTVALKKYKPGVYELTKMAIDARFQGQGLGKVLALAAINKVKALGGESIILYSNRKLATAISLYKKLGFHEVPVDGVYKRSDIKMQLLVTQNMGEPKVYGLRLGTLHDAILLSELARSTFYDTFAEHNIESDMQLYLSKNYSVSQLTHEIEDPSSTFLIAFDNHTAIGFVKLRVGNMEEQILASNRALEIARLYATKSYVGKGVGSLLMEACIDIAMKQQYATLWLGVWEHNQKAIAFYEKWGFTHCGSHPFILGNDAQTDLLMQKSIQEI